MYLVGHVTISYIVAIAKHSMLEAKRLTKWAGRKIELTLEHNH